MFARLYRQIFPSSFRNKIYDLFLGNLLFFLRNFPENFKSKIIRIFRPVLPKTIENELYAFMGKHGLTPYPYSFILEYKKKKIDCFWDNEQQMWYINHFGKKLYYPEIYTRKFVIDNYKSLLMEQDDCSPHQYFSQKDRLKGKTLLDIGAAEGIISLNAIEIVNRIYLFECEAHWIKALKATFSPWKEKVTIIPKYVGETNNEQTTTLDLFLKNKDKENLFLKMDIEGAEIETLKGARQLLQDSKNIDFSICTYHRKTDADEIKKIVSSYGFETEYTERFLYYEKDFRKAIIRKKIDTNSFLG